MTGFESQVAVFRQRLVAAGLGRFSDSLVQMARPSVRLVADCAVRVEVCASRLGGLPDLPSATGWPRNDGGPLSFIAQVNLADVASYDSEGVLPCDGLLSFFYAAVAQGGWGFDPADRGSAVVIHTPAHTATEQRERPDDLSDDGVFHPIGLRPGAS